MKKILLFVLICNAIAISVMAKPLSEKKIWKKTNTLVQENKSREAATFMRNHLDAVVAKKEAFWLLLGTQYGNIQLIDSALFYVNSVATSTDNEIRDGAQEQLSKLIPLKDKYKLHLAEGKRFYHNSEYGAANEAFDLALTADTGNYEVYFYLGRSLQQVGAYPSAQKRFYQALTKAGEPANFHGHVLEHVSENYLLQSEYEKSIHYADSALALDSTVYDAYLWIGQSAYALTDFEMGAKAMEQFTAQNQGSTLAYSILGNCYYEQQRYSSAIRAYNSALQLDSALAEVLSYKAKSHALLRQFQLSYNTFEALSKLHKDNFYAINGMGVCAYFLGDYDAALGYYIEANNLHQNMWFKYNLGLCYQQLGQYDNAIAMYNQVDAMQKWMPEVIVKKTECLLAAKKYDKLMQYTDEVIDIGAKFPFIRDIYLARAEAFKAQGNTERYEKNLRVANYVKGKMEINTNPRIE